MKRRSIGRIGVLLMGAAVVGCASASPHFYTLDATATAVSSPVAQTSVMVGPVTVPATVDRAELIVQAAPNRVEIEEYERWAAPLDDLIARAVAGDLIRILGTPDVTTAPLANFTPAYQVTLDVQRFESSKQTALIDAVWAVRRMRGSGKARIGRTVASQPVQGDGFDALAAAYSRALTQVSADIARTLQSDPE